MKVKFRISEIANAYHVINAISNWNPRCRPNIQEWYKAVFGLSTRDRDALERYGEVRRRCERGAGPESLVSWPFLACDDLDSAFDALRARLPGDDADSLRSCFGHFSENCGILYRRCLPDLERRKLELEAHVEGAGWDDLFGDLRTLFRSARDLPDLTVSLLINTTSGCTGGYVPVDDPALVVLEPKYLGKSRPEYISSDFSIIAHEAAHRVFSFGPDLKGEIRKSLELEGLETSHAAFVEEAIIGSQFPGGYLSVKHGLFAEPRVLECLAKAIPDKNSQPTHHLYALQNRLAAGIYAQARDLVDRRRSVLDDDFLGMTARRLRDLLAANCLQPEAPQE